jgi:hypothetical protein
MMMNISDEQLSAFLDAELPESEMEMIRQQISEDENLANRLAELAMVDEQIAHHYSAIDARPLPDAITQLLAAAPTETKTPVSAQVIAFPVWKKIQHGLQQHAAIAACTLLVLGYGFVQLLPDTQNSQRDNWSAIAAALDTTPSGTEQTLAQGQHLKPRLTFVNQEGNYCRQFFIADAQGSAESIACRINGEWQADVTVATHAVQDNVEYQTATNSAAVLDERLDNIMQGDALDAQAEAMIIQRGWKK